MNKVSWVCAMDSAGGAARNVFQICWFAGTCVLQTSVFYFHLTAGHAWATVFPAFRSPSRENDRDANPEGERLRALGAPRMTRLRSAVGQMVTGPGY
jgi:hypothetical protein